MFKRFTPPQILVGSFLLLIIIGSILLSFPCAVKSGDSNYLTALFTATSAVCVTGLVVQDTGTYWSSFGQVIIMLLIQIGGLGIMSFTTFYALLFGKKIRLRQRLVMQQALNNSSVGGIVNLFRHLLIFTFTAEFIFAIVLTLNWGSKLGLKKAIWFGFFHAISAFNNAGFDLFGNFSSLTHFTSDIITNISISTLFIFGGLGFVVIDELIAYRKTKSLSLHSRIVLVTTLILIILPAVIFFITEYNHALIGLSLTGKLTASFFQAVTPRTAGFNTLNLTSLFIANQFIIMILMFIGGSPGSTAGGIKTSTIAVVWTAIYSQIRGKTDAEIYYRRIANEDIFRALTIIALSLFFVIIMTLLVSFTQTGSFIKILFEVVSAFATVGLSLGLTTQLDVVGKILIIITMFAGRVGPLTLALAFAYRKKQPDIRYPQEKVMLG